MSWSAMALIFAGVAGLGGDGEGALPSYAGGPGTVIRCRSCTSVLVVITQIRGMSWLDVMGIGPLQENAVA
jgi:Family of unknown function (DUF6510)